MSPKKPYNYQDISATLSGPPAEPGLYVIATPIGHGADLTLRALHILKTADVVFCEDTRVTARLMALYGLEQPLRAYHDHNGDQMRPEILRQLADGAVVALVSDAGTPLISDPGYKLALAVREAGHTVITLPGASAPLAALTVSGLPTDRFFFEGFLPQKAAARGKRLSALKNIPATLVFFESPARVAAVLKDMGDLLGDRQCALCRELTKKHEEVLTGSLGELAARLAEVGPPKGEIVLVVGPPDAPKDVSDSELSDLLEKALHSHRMKEAVSIVTDATGAARNRVYQLALDIKNRS